MKVRSLAALALGGAALTACPVPGQGLPAIPSATANAYCGLAPQLRALWTSGPNAVDFTDAAQTRAFYEQATQRADEALAAAPPEVRADVEVLVADLRALVAALEAAGYEYTQAVEAYTPSTEHDAAQQRVEEYEREVCGIG